MITKKHFYRISITFIFIFVQYTSQAKQTLTKNKNNIKITQPKQNKGKQKNSSITLEQYILAQKQKKNNDIIRQTTTLGLGTSLATSMYYLFPHIHPINSLSSALFSSILGKMILDPVIYLSKKTGMLLFPFMIKGATKKVYHYKKVYQKRKKYLTKSMQGFLESWLERYRFGIEEKNFESRELENALEEILYFPLFPQKVTVNSSSIKIFLSKYPDDVKRTIGSFVVNTLEDSQILRLKKKSTPLMFVGPPGTGKTYLAKNLGQLLGLPVQVIDLSRYQNINGSSFWSQSGDKGILVDILQTENKKDINPANKILVLDEVDKVLALDDHGRFIHSNGASVVALLHHLLEAQTVDMPLKRYDNAKYSIAHLKIILIGNKTFTDVLGSRASALESRLHLIRFDEGFKKEQKLAIVQSYLNDLLQKYDLPKEKIEDQMIQNIIAEDEECNIKGVRILLNVIDRYVNHVKNQNLIANIAGISCKPFDVQKAYIGYKKVTKKQKKIPVKKN